MISRNRLFEIIEKGKRSDWVSISYDILMLIAINVSILPLMFVNDCAAFRWIEQITVSIFIVDYILRWCTADFKLKKGGWSFVLYPFTPMAVIDVLSILPGLRLLSPWFKVFRFTRILKLLRIFRFLRYSYKIEILLNVLKREKGVLLMALGLAVFYVFVSALVMFNVEPHINPVTGDVTFESFFDALYWATITLTTVGYGDLCPVTDIGRLVSMLSSLFGIAVIALPSGVITASYLEELRAKKKENKDS